MEPSISDRLIHDFGYHPPSTPAVARAHETARGMLLRVARLLTEITGEPSREQSLMVTNLEQAMFWANAAIARRQVELEDNPNTHGL